MYELQFLALGVPLLLAPFFVVLGLWLLLQFARLFGLPGLVGRLGAQVADAYVQNRRIGKRE